MNFPGFLRRRPTLPVDVLVLVSTVYIVLFCNGAFWRAVQSQRNDETGTGPGFLIAGFFFLLVGVHFLIFNLICWRFSVRPVISILIVVSAAVAYFMSTYTVFLDVPMVRNILQTDRGEVHDLVNWRMFAHIVLVGIIPALLVWWVRIEKTSFLTAMKRKVVFFLTTAGCLFVLFLLFSGQFMSFFQGARKTKHLVTPGNLIVSFIRVATETPPGRQEPRIVIGADAARGPALEASRRPVLFIFVLGETARARSFSLNGYERTTTPRLGDRDIINFPNVTSCGTSTAESLPCIFSKFPRKGYSPQKGKQFESLLSVVHRAGFKIVWRDNNSNCRSVCKGFIVEDLRKADNPDHCHDGECFDEILLDGLDEIVNDSGDLFIVLHQKGSHGPAYYRRYPPEFAMFEPACETADLSACTTEEVVNAYDNSILYTDYNLDRTIDFLETWSDQRDTALIYVSDHGESTGEHGLYLHGLPYVLAPDDQNHVPMIMWISPSFEDRFQIDRAMIEVQRNEQYSHDNIFHTVLGMLDIETREKEPALDMTVAPPGS